MARGIPAPGTVTGIALGFDYILTNLPNLDDAKPEPPRL